MLGPVLILNEEFSLSISQSVHNPSRAQSLHCILKKIIDHKLNTIQSFVNRMSNHAQKAYVLVNQTDMSQMQRFQPGQGSPSQKAAQLRKELDDVRLDQSLLRDDIHQFNQQIEQMKREMEDKVKELLEVNKKLKRRYDEAVGIIESNRLGYNYRCFIFQQENSLSALQETLDSYETWMHHTANMLSSIIPPRCRLDQYQNQHLRKKLSRQQKYQRNTQIMKKKHLILSNTLRQLYSKSITYLSEIQQDGQLSFDQAYQQNQEPCEHKKILSQIARIILEASNQLTLA